MFHFQNILFYVYKTAEGLFSIVLTILIVFPSLLLLWLFNSIIRLVISIYLRFSTGGEVRLTKNGLDNIWGYRGQNKENVTNSRNVLNVVVYEGQIDSDRYKRKFETDVINYREPNGTQPYLKLKEIFIRKCGYYCWRKDTDFNINNHVVVYPKEEIFGESELMELLSILSGDMDENHPQWQEIIIPSFVYDQDIDEGSGEVKKVQTLRILRFHHSYGDAGSWLLLYSYCMAGGKIPYAIDPLKGFNVTPFQKFLYYTSALIFGTTTMMRNVWYGTNVRANRLVTKNYSGDKSFAWTPIENLNLIKDIKTRSKTGIPTIIASAIASTLRKFDDTFPIGSQKLTALNNRDSYENSKIIAKLVDNNSFRLMRKENYNKHNNHKSYDIIEHNFNSANKKGILEVTDIGAVAAILPYPGLKLMNRFTIANFSLPTGDVGRRKRLNETHESCMQLARSPEPILNFWAFSFFGLFPIRVQEFLMQSAGTSLIFSNLPGASTTFELMGDAICDGGAWVPLLTCAGLSISAAGYRDGIRFCGSTDAACMTKGELKYFLETIVEEIKELHKEIVSNV